MNVLEGKNVVFWVKKLMEIWYLLITEKFLFWSFREWEVRPFLSQKVDGKMLFTDYWKVLVLNFSVIGKMVFFESRSWWKDDIYWLMKSFCFEFYGDGKYGLFFSQKVDEKMIYIIGLFEISMIFRDLGNMVFRTVLSA